jgi:hypothetical protein
MSKTPSAFIVQLERRINVANEIIDGLRGSPFSWGGGETTSKHRILKELGITLVTKTRARKLGYELNPRAKPVGATYFSSPISNYADVYVLECQCWRARQAESEAGK